MLVKKIVKLIINPKKNVPLLWKIVQQQLTYIFKNSALSKIKI